MKLAATIVIIFIAVACYYADMKGFDMHNMMHWREEDEPGDAGSADAADVRPDNRPGGPTARDY